MAIFESRIQMGNISHCCNCTVGFLSTSLLQNRFLQSFDDVPDQCTVVSLHNDLFSSDISSPHTLLPHVLVRQIWRQMCLPLLWFLLHYKTGLFNLGSILTWRTLLSEDHHCCHHTCGILRNIGNIRIAGPPKNIATSSEVSKDFCFVPWMTNASLDDWFRH